MQWKVDGLKINFFLKVWIFQPAMLVYWRVCIFAQIAIDSVDIEHFQYNTLDVTGFHGSWFRHVMFGSEVFEIRSTSLKC